MSAIPIAQEVRRVGLYVPDPVALAEFYREALGCKSSGRFLRVSLWISLVLVRPSSGRVL